ncbi:MAG: hypothetical protein F6K48_09095 [Okeania sp. SIO3H1]|nr:hypothetical protein [Okeania sp. SIO3H1]
MVGVGVRSQHTPAPPQPTPAPPRRAARRGSQEERGIIEEVVGKIVRVIFLP